MYNVEAIGNTTSCKLHKVSNGILWLPDWPLWGGSETGSVLSRIAPWDILGDAITSFSGYYEVVQGIGLKLLPKASL